MSGKHLTDQQVRLYMTHRINQSQKTAAAKASVSERSARRIERKDLQPAKNKRKHRTRADPLSSVWDDVVLPLLKSCNDISPVGVFDYLCENHLDKFKPSARRTLERRILQWRQLHGESQAVIFMQEHPPGALGICDFTHADFTVTIAGEPLQHKLFHYRLVSSGWAYAQVTYGGESFSAFSDGLQNAIHSSGGVPLEVRTDSLSAAYKNHQETEDFTARFAELISNYGFKATRNNRGVAHENGAIESPNRHIKNQIKQAILIRGNHDFATKKDYETFVASIMGRRNRRIRDKFLTEQQQLKPLPAASSVNYSEHLLRVSRTSTITLKRVVYTVPSRLVGSRLAVHLFDDRLDLYLSGVMTLTLDRIHASQGARARSVNYQHVIGSLVQKPRAFRCSQWRDELLPSEDYRHIWRYVDKELSADKACWYIVRLLNLAKKSDREEALGRFVLEGLSQGRLPSLFDCEDRFMPVTALLPDITIEQHALSHYQALLQEGSHE
ncbi:MAG: IS21 family transposase [Pseudomonadales bacterium]|nr:IS21 family transposase [Pseudomonadales bacterium]